MLTAKLSKLLLLGLLTNLLSAQQSSVPPASTAQPAPTRGAISKLDRERALGILNYLAKGIQEQYYDPKMNGVDWNRVVAAAKTRIDSANSLNDELMQIAVAVDSLNDSHTRFDPPDRPFHLNFGFEYKMVSDRCLVTRVRPGSDAEAKGLKPGAQILRINGIVPKRTNLFNIEYVNNVLDPHDKMQLQVQSLSGDPQRIEIQAKVSTSQDLAYRPGAGVRYDVIRSNENVRHRMRMQVEQFDAWAIIKIPWFFYPADDFYWLNGKIHGKKAVIVDLRGCPGGAVETLKYFIGMFFDHDVKLADAVERKKTSHEIARKEPPIYFPGQVLVLVDSESASAAEVFARVMQIEKRAKIIGDRTSGSVMESTYFYTASSGVDYGADVTIANLIMTDGKSLEHFGVIPDETALPTQEAVAVGNDPILSHAAKELGQTLSPEEAGKLFPYEWPKD
jgi:carboxyl-terminal processing protease